MYRHILLFYAKKKSLQMKSKKSFQVNVYVKVYVLLNKCYNVFLCKMNMYNTRGEYMNVLQLSKTKDLFFSH